MRFAFTDDQLAFRDAVRDLLDKECTPAHVRAAWTNETGPRPGPVGQARRDGRRRHARARSRRRARAHEVDLVLVLEETGRCAVPEPIVETAAFGVAARSAGTDRRRSAAATHRSVPWADTADVDRHRAPGGSTGAAVELVAARRRSTAPAACSRCTAAPRPPIDRRRRRAAAFDRGVLGIAAQLCGLADTHARHDRRLREGAPAVRRADRLVPGGEAPPRQRPHRARVRPPARLPGRGVDRDRDPEHGVHVSMAQGRRRRRRIRGARPRSSATARSATRPSTTCTCS